MFLAPRARLLVAAFVGISALEGCGRPESSDTPTLIVDTQRPEIPGLLVVLDSVPVTLDTAAARRGQQDRLLRALDGRTIDSIRFVPPDSAMPTLGSRAHQGVLRVWSRPPRP